jgi:FkbM family methyltransferase
MKQLAKGAIRKATDLRLRSSRLSCADALAWGRVIRERPGVYGDWRYVQRRRLSSGVTMDLGVEDVVECHLLTEGQWDPVVRAVLEAYLAPGGVFIDVGANIGYFTLLAAERVGPQGRVVACEPSLRALRKLTHHLHLNQCRNVTLIAAALGAAAGAAELRWAPESNIGGTAIGRGTASQGRTERVPVTTLDEVVARLEVQPQLLKVDVEGYEAHVFRGGCETLRTHRPAIVTELTDAFLADHGASAEQLIGQLRDFGYEGYALEWTGGTNGAGRALARPLSAQSPGASGKQLDALFVCEPPRLPAA